MVDPDRDPLEGVVEVDQAEIPCREGDAFFEPGNAGKILVVGAVEVIDRDTNQPKPRRKHAKYLTIIERASKRSGGRRAAARRPPVCDKMVRRQRSTPAKLNPSNQCIRYI